VPLARAGEYASNCFQLVVGRHHGLASERDKGCTVTSLRYHSGLCIHGTLSSKQSSLRFPSTLCSSELFGFKKKCIGPMDLCVSMGTGQSDTEAAGKRSR